VTFQRTNNESRRRSGRIHRDRCKVSDSRKKQDAFDSVVGGRGFGSFSEMHALRYSQNHRWMRKFLECVVLPRDPVLFVKALALFLPLALARQKPKMSIVVFALHPQKLFIRPAERIGMLIDLVFFGLGLCFAWALTKQRAKMFIISFA